MRQDHAGEGGSSYVVRVSDEFSGENVWSTVVSM